MLTRRRFLELPAVGALASCFGDDLVQPFDCGVASGDPTQSSVVLWTRYGGAVTDVAVTWVLARDEALRDVVATGDALASAEHDHCVKVVVDGLDADTSYYYQFAAGAARSQHGRTRTAPVHRDQLRFALCSCASLAHGYFHSYLHMADRDDLDAVIHVGDYIYEYRTGRYGNVRPYEPAHELVTLDDYRRRYRQYRQENWVLRWLHARHPMIAIWDDHEIANDCYRTGAANHDPDTQGPWQLRLEAALRAYLEYMPLPELGPASCLRTLDWGDLADLTLLDTRTERDPPATGWTDPTLRSDQRHIIGEGQEWTVMNRLASSPARWKLMCQTTMFGQRLHDDDLAAGQWDGYPVQRDRMLDGMASIPGVVVLGGDLHSSWALDLADPASYDPATGAGTHAVELIAPGITSPNVPPDDAAPQYAAIAQRSPHIKYVDLSRQGYIVLELDADTVRARFLHVDNVADPDAGTHTESAVMASAWAAPHWQRER